MKIFLAGDHAGFAHKQAVFEWLQTEGYAVVDQGAFTENSEDDFTDFVAQAARSVSVGNKEDKAIIFGGSGQGEAMLANRFPAVRAVVFYGGEDSVPSLSRQHNDSNVLSIGARFVDIDTTKKVIWEWLHTDIMPDPKYQRRNEKIEKITKLIYS